MRSFVCLFLETVAVGRSRKICLPLGKTEGFDFGRNLTFVGQTREPPTFSNSTSWIENGMEFYIYIYIINGYCPRLLNMVSLSLTPLWVNAQCWQRQWYMSKLSICEFVTCRGWELQAVLRNQRAVQFRSQTFGCLQTLRSVKQGGNSILGIGYLKLLRSGDLCWLTLCGKGVNENRRRRVVASLGAMVIPENGKEHTRNLAVS